MPDCPLCKYAHSVRLAHKKHWDYLLGLLRVFAYRCESCSSRFYRAGRPRAGVQQSETV